MLSIFTLMFVLTTWAYYYHFEFTLTQILSQEADLLNRYIVSDLNRSNQAHQERMKSFNQDADIALLYDTNPFTQALGIKLVEKEIKRLFHLYPYLEEVIFSQDLKVLLKVQRSSTEKATTGQDISDERSWTLNEFNLKYIHAKVSIKSNPIRLIQNHLSQNQINPSTRVYYQNVESMFLLSSKHQEKIKIKLSSQKPSLIAIDENTYLASPLITQQPILIATLLSLDHTQDALQSILKQAAISFTLLLILAFGVAALLSRGITQPLKRLELAASDIIKGNFSPIPLHKNDETRPALEAFNTMSKRLQGFTQELQRQVENRTTELKAANEKLALLNETDSLTQLKNRRFLEEKAPELLNLLKRNQLDMGIAMMDLDHFKSINDAYGHAIGDLCLVHVSQLALKHFQRESDYLIRFGGEEFCFLEFGGKKDNYFRRLESFRKLLDNSPVRIPNHPSISLTISIGGIYKKIEQEDALKPLISQADALLYQAKKAGRNRSVFQS